MAYNTNIDANTINDILKQLGTPNSSERLQDFLNTFQNKLAQKLQQEKYKDNAYLQQAQSVFNEVGSSFQDFKAPEAPSFVDAYTKLRDTFGLTGIEKALTEMRKQYENINSILRQRVNLEADKPVAMNVMQGRIKETERQMLEQADYVRRNMQTLSDYLNMGNAVIKNIMNYANMDWRNAYQVYNDEFSKAFRLYTTVNDEAYRRASFEERQRQFDIDLAKSKLQTIINLAASGKIDVRKMSAPEKAEIRKLEAKLGLPAGFTERIRLSPKDRILSMNIRDDNGYRWMDVIMYDENGRLKHIPLKLGWARRPVRTGNSSSITRQYLGELQKNPYKIEDVFWKEVFLNARKAKLFGADGRLSPDSVHKIWRFYAQKMGQHANLERFWMKMYPYVNPSHWQDYLVSGTNKEKYILKQLFGYHGNKAAESAMGGGAIPMPRNDTYNSGGGSGLSNGWFIRKFNQNYRTGKQEYQKQKKSSWWHNILRRFGI